ncbi:MAG TPA: hypothetical protein ENN99_16750 [Chloroflexi bacterium]|nr:hypothetical protein [Chloroflexota bacterium]
MVIPMAQALLALRWYLVVQFFGLTTLPLCLRLFRWLPDRGYTVSKPLGLLLTGWLFWLLTTFGWTRNTAGGILVAAALLVGTGVLLWWRDGLPGAPSRELIQAAELIFLLAFVVGCGVRANMPRIETAGGEKWMEIAFLRAILRAPTFPPHDPWLSGFAISYYYFGYLMIAMVTRLAAVPPSIAFNLAIATLLALTCTGAFGLVYQLVSSSSLSRGRWRDVLASLLGPVLVALMGNLEGFLQVLHARGVGSAAFWAWLDVRGIDSAPPPLAEGQWIPDRFFWWWQAARVVRDYTPWGVEQEVIDEFPAFSFILGDLHPHVLALPFVLLALALAFNLYRRVVEAESDSTFKLSGMGWTVSFPVCGWELFVYALCLGGLGFLNTWDFPIYLFVVVAAYTLASWYGRGRVFDWAQMGRSVVLLFVLLLVGVLLYLPFWIGFQSQAGGVLINLFNATRLPHFLVMFGPLVAVTAVFVFEQARRAGVRLYPVVGGALAVMVGTVGTLVVILGISALLIEWGIVPAQGAAGYVAAWLRSEPLPGLEGVANVHSLIAQRLLSRLVAPWTALGLVVLIVASVLALVRGQQSRPAASEPGASAAFALLLCVTGALLALGVEYVYLRDHFGTRMNTVFKFYFQAWVLWGIAAAFGVVAFLRRDGRRVGEWLMMGAAGLLVCAGLVYPVLAVQARAREYGGQPTLDGTAYLAETHPGDYAAIAWLNETVQGTPTILESPGDHFKAYGYEGRVSAHTGLPTLLGWGGHEHQWRGNYDEPARREHDIEMLYTSLRADQVFTLLNAYHIRYVYVGPLERTRYAPAGLAKFAGLLEPVYQTDSVTIYHYNDYD